MPIVQVEESARCVDVIRKSLLEDTFGRFDVDQNGFITLEEASTILRDEPFRFPPDKVLRLLKRFDKDGNGKLDYREFSGFYAEAKARFVATNTTTEYS